MTTLQCKALENREKAQRYHLPKKVSALLDTNAEVH